MLRGLRIHILLALILLLVTSASVQAQAYGRVTVFVKNDQGQPLQGVKVSVTCKDLDKYREETTTNKKGKATVSFTDATRFYDFHFEYEDYRPADLTIKPQIRSSITKEVVLSEGQVVTVGEGPDETSVVFSPAERVFNEGVTLLKSGDLAGAKVKFMEALGKNKDMAPAHSALAGIYIEEKDYEKALASANRFREIEPDDPNGLFALYDIHTALGNREDANAALETLKKQDRGGDTVALIYNAGVAAVKNGNFAGAKARFVEALELDAGLKEAMAALAVIYYTADKNFEAAAEWSEKHLAADPGNARSLRIRWESYRELGEDEAKIKAAFKELAAADPKVLIVEFYNKGNELFDAGDAAAASEQFKRILEIDPEHARAHYRLGVCLVSSGETDAAKTHLQKFIELAPDDPEAGAAKEMVSYLD